MSINKKATIYVYDNKTRGINIRGQAMILGSFLDGETVADQTKLWADGYRGLPLYLHCDHVKHFNSLISPSEVDIVFLCDEGAGLAVDEDAVRKALYGGNYIPPKVEAARSYLPADANTLRLFIDYSVKACHGDAMRAGWWTDLQTGESLIGKRNVGEMLALVHSEISEALEGYRKNLNDEHLPEFKSIAVELADAIIRICDLAGALDLPLGDALTKKMAYNRSRADHKPENRNAENGKKF